jgi:hypothetical protein
MQIYKITNLVNGKIYIGQHSKNNKNYLGSGKILKQAIKKYGKENFNKDIIQNCNTKKELDRLEIFWINYFKGIDIDNMYNLSIGGNGGNLGEKVNKIISIACKESFKKGRVNHQKGKPISYDQRIKSSISKRKNPQDKKWGWLKKYYEVLKIRKISEAIKVKCLLCGIEISKRNYIMPPHLARCIYSDFT